MVLTDNLLKIWNDTEIFPSAYQWLLYKQGLWVVQKK